MSAINNLVQHATSRSGDDEVCEITYGQAREILCLYFDSIKRASKLENQTRHREWNAPVDTYR